MDKIRRVMVDMSATLIHHGHIKLIEQASQHGEVIIGLTSDEEILARKGYQPELNFEQRQQIMSALQHVKEVVKTPWLISEELLDQHKIDLLVHGDDNSNSISADRLLILPRTPGVSSTELRQRALNSLVSISNRKLMLTPGPAYLSSANVRGLRPVFGRGDDDYSEIESRVLDWIKTLSGQENVVRLQGSATLALEVALKNFVAGKVLVVNTGYYSTRLCQLLDESCNIEQTTYESLPEHTGQYDWIVCCYVETSCGIKLDPNVLRQQTDRLGARLFMDATASIGLEPEHHVADLMAFSSCKGLFGLTGAAFIAYRDGLEVASGRVWRDSSYYLNLDTHQQLGVTGPYHAICALDEIRGQHPQMLERVVQSKEKTLELWQHCIDPAINQPLLCTYLRAKVEAVDDEVVLYSPRSPLPGSIICHMGELDVDGVHFHERIKVTPL
ncbi:MAG: adenylyltransferase/cytidyltransferase family protein [Halioglobus sp.]